MIFQQSQLERYTIILSRCKDSGQKDTAVPTSTLGYVLVCTARRAARVETAGSWSKCAHAPSQMTYGPLLWGAGGSKCTRRQLITAIFLFPHISAMDCAIADLRDPAAPFSHRSHALRSLEASIQSKIFWRMASRVLGWHFGGAIRSAEL